MTIFEKIIGLVNTLLLFGFLTFLWWGPMLFALVGGVLVILILLVVPILLGVTFFFRSRKQQRYRHFSLFEKVLGVIALINGLLLIALVGLGLFGA